MDPRAWFVTATIGSVMAALAANRIAMDMAMMGGLTILLIGDALFGGILSVPQALQGFASPALLLIGSLFVVAAGLEKTGGIEKVARVVLGKPKSEIGALFRLTVPVAFMSGLMNNTPIVAMYLGIVRDWSKRLGISSSRLYMPLSFAAIMGGKLTLFGTASNVVILGLYEDFVNRMPESQAGHYRLSQLEEFWGIAVLGLPTTLVGLLFLVLGVRYLLPDRRSAKEEEEDSRRFHVEMHILPGSSIHGKTVQEAGLRHLPGLFLASVERGDETRLAGRRLKLQSGDHLVFVGALESVLDLRKVPGLTPLESANQAQKEAALIQHDTMLIEAVVSGRSSLVGRNVRESNFRAKYNSAIWAVHRHGERLTGKIGEINLRAGDTLLLEAGPAAAEALKQSPDFYLASLVKESNAIRHDRANIALGILVAMVLAITATPLPAVVAALSGAALMILTRCIRSATARSSVNPQVLIVIGAALGLGQAMETSGAADALASFVVGTFSEASPSVMIFVLFMITASIAQLITNNGAAVLMFPLYMSVAESGVLSPHALIFTLMVAAGSTFISPISYQTNLMVYGPGSYRFLDFARLGLPLTIVLAIVCALIAPWGY